MSASVLLALARLCAMLFLLVSAGAEGERKEAEMGIVRPGERNPNWRGGRSVASNGYVIVRVGVGHHLADVRGYAYEHRVVAEQKIGRPLAKGEHVHHADGNRQNNAPENLEVLTHAEHFVEHRGPRKHALRIPGEPNPKIQCACGCGEMFARYDASRRPRRYVPGHNQTKGSKYQDAIVAALADGPKSRGQIAEATGASAAVMGVTLARIEKSGLVAQVARGVWALPPRDVDLPLELARAAADCLLSVGVHMDRAAAAEVARALRTVADQYEQQWAQEEAA